MNTSIHNDSQKLNRASFISNVVESPKAGEETDLLETEKFVDGVVDFIDHADTPLSIALNGKWGSGKTSIINAIKSKLCDDENAKYHGILINTWQFSLLDSSSAPQAVIRILQSIVNQIVALKPDYERRKQISQLIGALATISSGLKSVSDTAVDPLFGVGKSTFSLAEKALNALNKCYNKTNQSQMDNAALVKQLSNEIQKLVDEVLTIPNTKKTQEDRVAKYEPYNPVLISEIPNYFCAKFIYFAYFCICNLAITTVFIVYYLGLMFFKIIFGFIGGTVLSIVKVLPIIKNIFDFCHYVVKVGDAICHNEEWPSNKRDGFIFFIDDLDRINPIMALEIIEFLESIFNFKKCVFILAIDRDVLLKSAELKLVERNLIDGKSAKSDIDAECRYYLNRFIHISIDVPKERYNTNILLRESLQKISFFSTDELKDSKIISFLNEVTDCLFYKNPRAIKQVVNQLSMLDKLRRHAWSSDAESDHNLEITIKVIVFIVQCVKMVYPELFVPLMIEPYFKDWHIRFIKQFNTFNSNITKIDLERLIGEHDIKEWEYALFCVCGFDKKSVHQFYCIRSVFVIIEMVINNYIESQENDSKPSPKPKALDKSVYIKIITEAYKIFYLSSANIIKFGTSPNGRLIESYLVKK